MLSYSTGAPQKQMAKIHSFIVPEWEGFNFHTHGGIFNLLKHTMVSSNIVFIIFLIGIVFFYLDKCLLKFDIAKLKIKFFIQIFIY